MKDTTRYTSDLANNFVSRLSASKDRLTLFREIPVNNQGFVLLDLSRHIRKEILSALDNHEIVQLLHYLDPDEATDLLQNLNILRKRSVIAKLRRDFKKKVEFLLQFDPKTAAGIMDLNYVEVEKGATFEKVSRIIRKHERRRGRFPAILVVFNGFLAGELPGDLFIMHGCREKIDPYIKNIPVVSYTWHQDRVINVFKKHPHHKVVVLNDDQSILGVIHSDDIIRLLHKQEARHLADFAGISDEEDIFDSALTKVKFRYKWLIINLGTAFIAAFVVGMFEETIATFVFLAAYLPIVAGMGGNAGTQTLAVVVRGLALKEIEFSTASRVVRNEMIAGGINGLINGVIVAIIALFLNKSPLLGLIVGIALVGNLIIAGLFGTFIPLLMQKLGKDPASSASIFITTATDVFGFFFFLGLASIVLP